VLDPVTSQSTTLLNNFYGRQFNSLNDLAIHPKSKDIYVTDPSYGQSNNFRPPAGMPKQVYRFNDRTGAVTVAADGFIMPNGICFSADGKVAYVTDTGMWRNGLELENPSSMYVVPTDSD
jgi:gluconolactonase